MRLLHQESLLDLSRCEPATQSRVVKKYEKGSAVEESDKSCTTATVDFTEGYLDPISP